MSFLPLVASIAGGDRAYSTSWGQPALVLNGSSSDDGAATWSCTFLSDGSLCFEPDTLASLASDKILTVSNALLPVTPENEALVFTLRLVDGRRSAAATSRITVLEERVPEVIILAEPGPVLADRPLRLQAIVTNAGNSAYIYEWICTSGNLHLLAPGVLATTSDGRNMVVNTAQMLAGGFYSFRYYTALHISQGVW